MTIQNAKRRCAVAAIIAGISTAALGPGAGYPAIAGQEKAAAVLASDTALPQLQQEQAHLVYPLRLAAAAFGPALHDVGMESVQEPQQQEDFAIEPGMLPGPGTTALGLFPGGQSGAMGAEAGAAHPQGAYAAAFSSMSPSLPLGRAASPVKGSSVALDNEAAPGTAEQTVAEDSPGLPLLLPSGLAPALGEAFDGLPVSAPDNIGGPANSVPEPGTLMLLACGVFGLAAARTRLLRRPEVI